MSSQQYATSKGRVDSPAAVSQSPASGRNAPQADDYFGRLPSQHTDDAQAQRDRLVDMEEHRQRFAAARDSLVSAIDETGTVLTSLQEFNKKRWIVHYPAIDRKAPSSSSHSQHQRRRQLRRSQSVDPREEERNAAAQSKTKAAPAAHPGLHRSATDMIASSSGGNHSSSAPPSPPSSTLAASSLTEEEGEGDEATLVDDADQPAEDQNEMSVLRLDLKLGAIGNNPQALVHSLEKSSVAQLLDERMTSSIRQLDSLRERISDTQSKVLVTGDLNAGKSTFVNSLMRRKLLPVDQQPCTTVFCEVLDAERANSGREEVHLIKPGMVYDLQNDNTYTLHTLDDIEQIVADAEELSPEDAPMVKCYCHDTRSTQESLLRNGIVDIALIDAPGLNRDSLKTTALFARQDQIDVVVFVVSAENHFTLSAKEFLWNASNDKAYIFIVVNKFDQIRNKDKCKRLVLEQIRQLSPRTYEDAEELVHFVDSGSVFGSDGEMAVPMTPTPTGKVTAHGNEQNDTNAVDSSALSFTRLEACLRDFVLQRREKSKLMPAQTYLLRLLSDIEFLAHTNLGVATAELEEAKRLLEDARPALAQCKAAHAKIEAQLEGEEDGVVNGVSSQAQSALSNAVELIGQGKPASAQIQLPPYPGFFSALDYAASVRDVFVQSLEVAVREAEQAARTATGEAVARIKEMGDTHLPSDVERSNREFRPDAMFAKRLRRQNAGVVGLGLTEQITDARMSDVFDVHHYIHIVTRTQENDGDDVDSTKKKLQDHEEELTVVSGVSLGLGALTLLGGKAYGAKSALDAIVNITNVISNPTLRKWAPTIAAVATAGFAVYVIHDLPNSIPRNVGRSMRKELATSSAPPSDSKPLRRRSSIFIAADVADGSVDEEGMSSTTIVPREGGAASQALSSSTSISFTIYHQRRLSREVRKVLRLAGWDLQERFRVALAERRGVVERLEGQEKKSEEALTWFGQTREKVGEVCQRVRDVEIAS